MRLKLLAISDTHLGEDTSLLSFPQGRQHLWRVLGEHFGEGAQNKFDVDELILVGDITDRTLSSTSQIITHTNAFIQTLGSAANIKKGVFIPGNHEHTLWTDYHRRRDRNNASFSVTEPGGELIVQAGERLDKNQCAEELLAIFLGYPSGSTWRAIEDAKGSDHALDFAVANPLYAKVTDETTYVFMHGAHFCKLACDGRKCLKIADWLQLDRLAAGLEIESGIDLGKAKNLEDLERMMSPFMDSIWPSSENRPTSQSDEFWFVLCALQGKFSRPGERRASPRQSRLFRSSDIAKGAGRRIGRLTARDGSVLCDSVERWEKYCRAPMLEYLDRKGLPTDKVVLVYGDTHAGGWGQLRSEPGSEVRLYNTGGWVVLGENDHPACHLFAVGENGEEYLLDVSFGEQWVGNDRLLKLAGQDFEHRLTRVGRATRAITKWLSK